VVDRVGAPVKAVVDKVADPVKAAVRVVVAPAVAVATRAALREINSRDRAMTIFGRTPVQFVQRSWFWPQEQAAA
jgi:hypothetical protein